MLTHSSPEVIEAFRSRQSTTGRDELWTTRPGALWRDGYIAGREEGRTAYVQQQNWQRRFEEMQEAELRLNDAYIRLRTIAGATQVPDYWRPEEPDRVWSWTEARLKTIVEERDYLLKTLDEVKMAVRGLAIRTVGEAK